MPLPGKGRPIDTRGEFTYSEASPIIENGVPCRLSFDESGARPIQENGTARHD